MPPPAPAPVQSPTTSASSMRQVPSSTSLSSSSPFLPHDAPAGLSSSGGGAAPGRLLRDQDSDSDTDPLLSPLSQHARTRNSETSFSPMNNASFNMRRGSTTDQLPGSELNGATPPTTPAVAVSTPTTPAARSSFLTSTEQELDARPRVRDPAISTTASPSPKIAPLSLRRRESSPLLLRQATMPVTASDKSVYQKRDFTSLRSRSPSAERDLSTPKSRTNQDNPFYRTTQYAPTSTSSRPARYDSSRYSGNTTGSRSGLSSLSGIGSSSNSAPRSSGLARSSTVGDMLSRSSRYSSGSDQDMTSSYSSSSSSRDPFARRSSPSSATTTSSSSRSSYGSGSSYRKPGLTSSITLTDATSKEKFGYRTVTRASLSACLSLPIPSSTASLMLTRMQVCTRTVVRLWTECPAERRTVEHAISECGDADSNHAECR